MKNKFKLFGIIAIAAAIGTILAGCASMQLVSLETDTVDGPRQVRQGQDINPRDITVWGIYKDESRKKVTVRSEHIVFDKHTPGPQTVRIRISGKEAGFQTQVMALISLTAAFRPATEFFAGEEPNPAWPGLEIRGEWDQMGSGRIDTASCQITGYNKEQVGRQTITVSYESKTATFSVDVLQTLNGTWVIVVAEIEMGYRFNNGNYESFTSGNPYPSAQGTYTANGGKLTMTQTHYHGTAGLERYYDLAPRFYTRNELEAAIRASEYGKRESEEDITETLDNVFQTWTYDYSLSGNTLTLTSKEEDRFGIVPPPTVYTRK